jgi:hypothetical protein
VEKPRGHQTVRITDRDRELLAFVAEHRLVLIGHVASLLGVSAAAAYARLAALCKQGSLKHDRVFEHGPGHYRITRPGLAVIDSGLPPPRVDLRAYQHDVGVAWLWLAARSGAFGPLQGVISERHMRSHDGARDRLNPNRGGDPLGVRLGGFGPGGRERLHYPDLLLVDPHGNRVAVELELTGKSLRRREQILGGYAASRQVAAVVYLVIDPAVGRRVQASAERLGIADMVHVRPAQWGATQVARAGGAGRRRAPTRDTPEAAR